MSKKKKCKPKNTDACDSRSEMFKWIQEEGSWEKLKPEVQAVTELAQKGGAQKVFLFGFCWGGTPS